MPKSLHLDCRILCTYTAENCVLLIAANIVFDLVTIDGFLAGPNCEIDWFKTDDEFYEFVRENSKAYDAIIFGRSTYEMMASYWSTPDADNDDSQLTEVLRNTPKIVISKTLKKVKEGPNWKNITLWHEIRQEDIIKLKEQEGKEIAIFGSGTIVQQLANLDLIDEYRLLVIPVVLGAGKFLFEDFKKMDIRLPASRSVKNGNVLFCCQPSGLHRQ